MKESVLVFLNKNNTTIIIFDDFGVW